MALEENTSQDLRKKRGFFFDPWIGEHYDEGFKGVRTLVVGVCHFCTESCGFRRQCSSAKEIWELDSRCPFYSNFEDKDYYRLHNSNDIEIRSFIDGDAPYPSYKLFTYYMLKCAGDLSSEKKRELWDHVVFTNFLQFFHDDKDALPSLPVLYEEAYPAFREIVEKLNPEVVYVWNNETKKCLATHKEDLKYIGKADLALGIPIYVFLPNNSQLKGTRLARLRYRFGVQSEKHHIGWYRRLLKKHLEKSMFETESDKGKTINRLANDFMNLVDDGLLGSTEDHLYFKDTDHHRWTSQLKGFFLISVRQAYPVFGQGFNPGMEAIFGERLSTNKRNPDESKGPEAKIAQAIRRAFPIHKLNKPPKSKK